MKLFFKAALTLSFFLSFYCVPSFSQTAIEKHLNKPEPEYKWSVHEKIEKENYTIYVLKLTSQKWKDMIWVHQLSLFIPEKIDNNNHSLLFISGGKIENGQPKWTDSNKEDRYGLGKMSVATQSPMALLKQVPNQPIFGGRVEDEIISYTFHKYQETNDDSWPLLFPMVKSAVKAMDAIQEFGKKELKIDIDKFVVTGASKRGWTTWLTGANDERVTAIAPMVIDVLNMSVQMEYQKEAWGDYSPEIQDYVDLGIPQQAASDEGKKLLGLVDPYTYRKKLKMPKLIFNGTNDPYWPADAIKHYLNEIPGENHLLYVPNAGHDLGDGKLALEALAAFYKETISSTKHPVVKWKAHDEGEKISISIRADRPFEKANLWVANSEGDRDFRDEKFVAQSLDLDSKKDIKASIDFPENGYKAFYVELIFKSPLGGTYSQTTQMYVSDKSNLQ
ncbi:PhoPQ-activated pathogenicity-related family protein [Flexithrix dorotheae]|uniref:PhoPQ-activated pathogenicity-related family protein n=1 Tax=Flexithrix dorotheae TaxID=70993 RepID=UPI0003649B78|nr:PhoPQ-activated protein PqaA family protein [Flexithrix dorotheae]